jgi:hypothetical protein
VDEILVIVEIFWRIEFVVFVFGSIDGLLPRLDQLLLEIVHGVIGSTVRIHLVSDAYQNVSELIEGLGLLINLRPVKL